jgi:hypothetical protein
VAEKLAFQQVLGDRVAVDGGCLANEVEHKRAGWPFS